MRTTVLGLIFLGFATLIPTTLASQKDTPAIPDTGTLTGTVLAATSTPAFPEAPNKPRTAADMRPVGVSIPAIGLDDSIEGMGVLRNGELAVPSGKTSLVGWYADGTVPGEEGSAVLDAHVFAAFKNINKLKAGDSIYITDADGTVLHFIVMTSEYFKLGALSADYLFNRDDAKRLTLITCAGKLTADHSTYDHRLVVSAVLAS